MFHLLIVSLVYNRQVVFGQFALKRGVPLDEKLLQETLTKYSTDPIYKNLYIDLVGHF